MAQAFIMVPDISKAILSQRTLLLIMKRQPTIPFKGGKNLGEDVGKIEFKNVKFSYPSHHHSHWTFEKVNPLLLLVLLVQESRPWLDY